MEPLRNWKIILSLTAIFVAGAVTGSVITFQVVKSIVRSRTNPDQWSARIMREYRHHLQLTPDQVEHIKPRMMEANRQMKLMRTDLMQQHGQIYRQIHSEIMQVLTPQQREAFKRLRQKKMARFQEQQPNLRNRPTMQPNRQPGNPSAAWREKMQRERWHEQPGAMNSSPRRLNSVEEKSKRPEFDDGSTKEKKQ